jgi:tellurium resistance protein TerD
MSVINLEKIDKGQRIDLTKKHDGLKKLQLGMGWAKKGMGTIDLDASIVLVKADGKVKETVSYQKFNSSCRGVKHHGDDLDGGGRADAPNEKIDVIFDSVAADVDKCVIIMNTFSSGFKFKDLKNAWIRLSNADSKKDLYQFTLSDDKSVADNKALFFGEVYRHNGEWKFNALGIATNHNNIAEMERAIASKDYSSGSTPSQDSSSSNSGGGIMGRLRGLMN